MMKNHRNKTVKEKVLSLEKEKITIPRSFGKINLGAGKLGYGIVTKANTDLEN